MFTNKSTPPPLPQSPPQLLPPVDHPFSDRMRPLHEWGIFPLSNGKICSLPRENFFSHQRKNSRCPARWALPSPSPACALQTHAPVPRHTATHARRRAMRKITTSHASATIPHDDDTIKTRLTCMHKRLAPTMTPMTMTPMTMGFARNSTRPCGSWLRNRETVTDTKRRGILGMSRRIFLRDGELLAAMPLANQ